MNRVLSRMPFWARVGAIVGALVGIFTSTETIEGANSPTIREVVIIGVISGSAAWVVGLLMLCGWLRYRLSDVVLMTLLIAEVSALVIAYLTDVLRVEGFGPLLGLIVGLVIGAAAEAVLCKFCTSRRLVAEERRHA